MDGAEHSQWRWSLGKAEINLILLFSISLLCPCVRVCCVVCCYVCCSDSGIILRLLFLHACGTCMREKRTRTLTQTHSLQLYGIRLARLLFPLLFYIIKYFETIDSRVARTYPAISFSFRVRSVQNTFCVPIFICFF